MKTLRLLFLSSLLSITLGYATSATAGVIQGAGAIPCGKWISERATGGHNMALAWVMGFMSSYNHYVRSSSKRNGVFGEIDHNSIALWMDNYCKSNPLESVYSGSDKLIEEMNEK